MITFTYQEYQKSPNTITFQESEEIYNQILELADAHDKDFSELWSELMQKVIKYANMRAKWYVEFSREERADQDDSRSSVHDTVISRFNVISRYLENQGKDISWREKLGNERKRIGDFACYLAYVYGLNSR